jgi:hypothetical protein
MINNNPHNRKPPHHMPTQRLSRGSNNTEKREKKMNKMINAIMWGFFFLTDCGDKQIILFLVYHFLSGAIWMTSLLICVAFLGCRVEYFFLIYK